MYHTITAVGLLFVIVISPTAKAQDKSRFESSGFANLEYCKYSPQHYPKLTAIYETGFHDGYCNGVVSGTLIALGLSHAICLPYGVTNGQALRVVINYMEQHPELLHHDLAELAADASRIAFACDGTGGNLTW
jgi:hypothetical protein